MKFNLNTSVGIIFGTFLLFTGKVFNDCRGLYVLKYLADFADGADFLIYSIK